MVKSLLYLFILSFFSCSSGHNNQYGIYVPNGSRYTLKDKVIDDIPKQLDTVNLYKYVGYYDNNLLIKDTLDNRNWKIYHKFCPNGRVYGFGTDKLEEKNLNPNLASPSYYVYDKKKNEIKYEVFTNGNGGQFVILSYKLSKNGDSLTGSIKEKCRSLYIKEAIPKSWKKYKPNW